MKPMTRRSRGGVQLDHENRIQTLERRISNDYPRVYSLLLGTLNSITGPGTFDLGWAFGDPCSGDPVECEDSFVTDGNYLLLPTGYNDPFEVHMQIARSGGAFANYLAPVTPGSITPTDDLDLYFVAYIWRDNAPFSYTTASIAEYSGQEPPMRTAGGYDRVWWNYRLLGGNATLDESRDRYALRPIVKLNAAITVSIAGLAMGVILHPPGQLNQTGWSG